MSSPFNNAKPSSVEQRALKEIDSSTKTFVNKDFVKNMAWLNQSVDTHSAFLSKLQSGVDDANMNVIEEIGGFASDLFVLFAGGEPTGIEIGDLKYIIQGIGSMLGINPETPFPLNLIDAAANLLDNFIIPLEQFTDVIFDSIIAWATDFGLSESFVNSLIELQSAISSLGAGFDDLFEAIKELLGAFGFFDWSTGLIGALWDGMIGLLDLVPWDFLADVLSLLADLGTPFIKALTWILNTGTGILGAFSGKSIKKISANVAPVPADNTTIWTVGIDPDTTWVFDDSFTSDGNTGSFKTNGTGTAKRILTQGVFTCFQDDVFLVSAFARWAGIPSAADDFGISIVFFNGSTEIDSVNVNMPSGHGATGGWTTLGSTEITVPSGVDSFKIGVRVGSSVNTGTVWIDSISVKLKGDVEGDAIPFLDATKIIGGVFDFALIPIDLIFDFVSDLFNSLFGWLAPITQIFDSLFKALFDGDPDTGPILGFIDWLQKLPDLIETLYGGQTFLEYILASIIPALDASKITTGTMPQDRIEGLSTALASKLGTETFDAINQTGSNFASDPKMSIDALWTDTADATLRISSDIGYWGLTSLKMTALRNGPSWYPMADLVRTIYGAGAAVVTAPGDKFDCSIYVRAKFGNADTKTVFLQTLMEDSQGVNSPVTTATGTTPGTAIWKKIEHNVIVPTGYDTIRFRIYVDSNSTPGDVYYWDTPVIRETTKPGNIIQAIFGDPDIQSVVDAGVIPTLDQSKIDGLTDDLGNLLPRETFDAIRPGGQNIASDPTMSTASLWNDTSTASYGIANIGYWGTKSLAITPLIPANNPSVYFIRTSIGNPAGLIVLEGDKFDFSCRVRAKSGNSGSSSYMNVQAIFSDSNENLSNILQSGPTPVLPNTSSWQLVSMDVVVPDGYDTVQFRVFLDTNCVVNDVYYVDDPKIFETTKPTNIAEAIFGQKQVATTLWPAAIPGLDASKISTGTLSDSRIPELEQSKVTNLTSDLGAKLPTVAFEGKTSGGINLASDPDCSRSALWTAGTSCTPSISNEQSHSGTTSLKLVFTGTAAYPTIDFIRTPSGGESGDAMLSVRPGDKFYMSMWIRSKATNVDATITAYIQAWSTDSTGVNTYSFSNSAQIVPNSSSWQQITHTFTIPSGRDRLRVRVGFVDPAPFNAGDAFYVDDIVLEDRTGTTNLNQSLYGENDPASTVLPGAVPVLDQSKVNNLGTDLAAKLPRETFDAITPGGKNIATDPTMSTESLWQDDAPGTTYAIGNIGFWGIKSLEMTCVAPVSNPSVYFVRNSEGYRAGIITQGNDKFDFSCYVRAKSGNVGSSAQARLLALVTDSTGVLTQQNIDFSDPVTPSTSLWKKVSTDITIPIGYDTVEFRLYISGATANDKYYVDNPVIRETTAPTSIAEAIFGQKQIATTIQPEAVPSLDSSKITTGTLSDSRIPTLAQSKITGLSDALVNLVTATTSATANLCGDPTISINEYWAGNLTAYLSLDGTEKRSGTQSLKFEADGINYHGLDLLRSPTTGLLSYVKASAGQRYRLEFYAKGGLGNTSIDKAYMQLHASDSTGVLSPVNMSAPNFTPNTSDWTYYSTEGVFPTGYDQLRALIGWRNTADDGDVMWVEDITVTNISAITDIISTIVGGLDGSGLTLSDLATAVENIPGGNIASAILSSIVPSLDASKINTGTLSDGRIPALAQSKVTGLVTDLGAKVETSTFNISRLAVHNIVGNPSFEDTSFYTGGGSYSTTVARTGTQSIKANNQTTGWAIWLSIRSTGIQRVSIKPGDVLYMEAYIYGDPSNTLSGGVFSLYGQTFTELSGGSIVENENISAIPANTALNGVWTKWSGYHQFTEADGKFLQFGIYQSGINASQNYYIDDPYVRFVTDANEINQALYGANAPASTVLSGAVPALDASKINTGTLGDSRIPTLAQSKITGLSDSLANLVAATTSSNLVGDPTVKSSNYWSGLGTDISINTSEKRSGTQSIEIIRGATNRAVDIIRSPDTGAVLLARIKSGQRYRIECYAKAGDSNTSTGNYGYLQLYFTDSSSALSPASTVLAIGPTNSEFNYFSHEWTAPAGYDQMRALVGIYNGESYIGEVVYYDDFAVTNITEISNIISTIVGGLDGSGLTLSDLATAVENIPGGNIASAILSSIVPSLDASKINTGTLSDGRIPALAQSKVTGLVTDLGAKVETSAFNAKLIAGDNICTNPSFEDTSQYIHHSAIYSYSTEQSRNGTTSLKAVSNGSLFAVHDLMTTNSSYLNFSAYGGQVFHIEFWVRGHESNAQTSGGSNGIGIYLQYRDSDETYIGSSAAYMEASTALNGVWTKHSAYITVPANPLISLARFFILLRGDTAVTSGETYYFDDASIRWVTETSQINLNLFGAQEASSAILSAAVPALDASKINTGTLGDSRIPTLAQSKITGLVTDLDLARTLSVDSENLVSGSGFEGVNPWPGATGMSVATDQFHGGTKSLKLTGTAGSNPKYPLLFEVQPGDQFYVEFWARRDSAFNHAAGGADGSRFRLVRSNGSTFLSVYFRTNELPAANTWYKCSGIGTAPSDVGSYMEIMIFLPPAGTAGTVWLDDIVVRRIKTGNSIADAAISNIKLVNDIDATKISSGVLGTSLIPILSQSKITNLTSDLTNAQTSADLAQELSKAGISSGRNLINNPGFESSSFYHGTTGASGERSSEQSRSGTYSRKVTHNGSSYGIIRLSTDNAQEVTIPCRGNDIFYTEAWVYGHASNADTAQSIWFQWYWRKTDGSTGVATGGSINAGNARKGVWSKLSHTFTVPSDAVGITQFWLVTGNIIPDGNIYYADDAVLYDITEAAAINQALYGANAPASTVLSGAVPALDASKINTGTLGDSRIPTLAQSKITSLTADLAARLTSASALNASNISSGTVNATYVGALDASKISTGTLGISRIPTGDLDKDNISDLGSIVDNVANAFLGGDSLVGTALSYARDAMDKIYSDLAKNTRSIQDLQAKSAGAQAKGTVVNIDFSDYADGDLPSIFTVNYTGAGTSTLGVVNGVAQWRNTNNADRRAKVRYNVAPTDTDFQIIRGTMAMAPQEEIGGGKPYFYARGRVSADDNNYVWARAYCNGWFIYKCDIGYAVGGTEYVWSSNNNLTWALDMSFVLGVGTNPRQYQVWSGNTMVKQHTESGTASMLGSAYRYWGCIAEIKSGSSNPRHSGKIGGSSVADNAPPVVNGSCARMYRTGTGTESFPAGGPTEIPSSFFSHVEYESPDVDADTTNGTFTVTEAKPYKITARIRRTASMFSIGSLVLQRKASGGSWTDAQYGPDQYMGHGSSAIYASWTQYLEVGDQVRLATYNSGGALSCLSGESDGNETFFTIAGAG